METIIAKCSVGKHRDVHVRFARSLDRIYVDLCDPQWRAVEITREGWKVVTNPPVLFRRPNGAKALPEPTRGGSLKDLRKLVNVSDDQFTLALGWMVNTFLPVGGFLHMILEGEQGSAKTTFVRLIQSLLDPSEAGLTGLPKNEEDATLVASHCGILAYDNLSGCRAEMSDILCRFSTGQAFKVRTLYTNLDLTIVSVRVPALINGIDLMGMRPDLLQRSIVLKLFKVPDGNRREEFEIYRDFERIHAGCLGALFDAVAAGLKNFPTIKVPNLPRMADACRWVTACEEGMGAQRGKFLEAYRKQQKSSEAEIVDNDLPTSDRFS